MKKMKETKLIENLISYNFALIEKFHKINCLRVTVIQRTKQNLN